MSYLENKTSFPDLLQDKPNVLDFQAAAERLRPEILETPFQLNARLSVLYQCQVFLKKYFLSTDEEKNQHKKFFPGMGLI